jgi:SAM-dependent methyltransferase
MVGEYYNLTDDNRFPMGPLRIDVASLYDRTPITKSNCARPGFVPAFQDAFHRFIYRCPLIPLPLRVKAKAVLRTINLDNLWLKHFQDYWVNLGGRPLWHVSDFFFLRNFYRLRQPPPNPNTIETTSGHLAAWQEQDFLYGLFDSVLKESFSSEYEYLRLLHSLKPGWSSLLEYGAGSAPITSSIVQHGCWRRGCSCMISDIPTLTFHYAAYKFRCCSNVEPVLLRSEDEFQFITDRQFDVVFCCQVFEHLNRPLDTVKRLTQALKPKGVLFFDYIKSEAKGLDSHQGLVERESVLDYISSAFHVEYGEIRKDQNVGLTAARKTQ